MTDSITVQLKGDKDIRAAFRDLRDYLPKSALRTSVRVAAQFLQAFIILVAPVLTGRLRRNITVATHATGSTIRARVVVETQGKRGDPNNAFYWRFLEKGFHDRAGKFHIFSFIQGVFDSKNREAAQTVIDSVEKAIDRAEQRARH
jgi:HK97 gp10 family phage protein